MATDKNEQLNEILRKYLPQAEVEGRKEQLAKVEAFGQTERHQRVIRAFEQLKTLKREALIRAREQLRATSQLSGESKLFWDDVASITGISQDHPDFELIIAMVIEEDLKALEEKLNPRSQCTLMEGF